MNKKIVLGIIEEMLKECEKLSDKKTANNAIKKITELNKNFEKEIEEIK